MRVSDQAFSSIKNQGIFQPAQRVSERSAKVDKIADWLHEHDITLEPGDFEQALYTGWIKIPLDVLEQLADGKESE